MIRRMTRYRKKEKPHLLVGDIPFVDLQVILQEKSSNCFSRSCLGKKRLTLNGADAESPLRCYEAVYFCVWEILRISIREKFVKYPKA